jgi:hypothetical protein
MQRRRLFSTLAAITLMATSAYAESVPDQIMRQLRDQGFGQISVTQTWLGRTRIIGKSDKGQREIIVNPKTGEILRDLFTNAGGSAGSPVIGNTGSGRNTRSDDDDDDDDDDNSGSGGGDDNSGSGGGGDDGDDDDDSGSGGGDDGDDDDNSGSGGGGGDDDNSGSDDGGGDKGDSDSDDGDDD